MKFERDGEPFRMLKKDKNSGTKGQNSYMSNIVLLSRGFCEILLFPCRKSLLFSLHFGKLKEPHKTEYCMLARVYPRSMVFTILVKTHAHNPCYGGKVLCGSKRSIAFFVRGFVWGCALFCFMDEHTQDCFQYSEERI